METTCKQFGNYFFNPIVEDDKLVGFITEPDDDDDDQESEPRTVYFDKPRAFQVFDYDNTFYLFVAQPVPYTNNLTDSLRTYADNNNYFDCHGDCLDYVTYLGTFKFPLLDVESKQPLTLTYKDLLEDCPDNEEADTLIWEEDESVFDCDYVTVTTGRFDFFQFRTKKFKTIKDARRWFNNQFLKQVQEDGSINPVIIAQWQVVGAKFDSDESEKAKYHLASIQEEEDCFD